MVLPISRDTVPPTDLETLAIHVPFHGQAELPQQNFSRSGDSTYSRRPMHASILGMTVVEPHLVVALASPYGQRAVLLFDLEKIRQKR